MSDQSNQPAKPAPRGYKPNQPVQFFNPPKTLKRAILPGKPKGMDPEVIARAEADLSKLEAEFGHWMQDDIDALKAAVDALDHELIKDSCLQEIHRHAHTIRGNARTYGFHLAAEAADSFCFYLDACRLIGKPTAIIMQKFTEAIIAMARAEKEDGDHKVADILVEALRVLAAEQQDRAEKIAKAAKANSADGLNNMAHS